MIQIDPRPLHAISPYLTMQFAEPLGNADSSIDAAWDYVAEQWQPSTVEIIRKLAPPMIRWGGCFSSYYHWQEAVGPRHERRPMLNLTWEGVYSNQVGTAEIADLCRTVGADPLFCVNFESDGRRNWARPRPDMDRLGTAQEAAEAAGTDFATLQSMNPALQTEEDELTAGTVLTTSQPTAELLQVKVVERQSVVEEIPYETVETESDEYDFGKRVTVQEGQNGQQEVVSNVTYIGGNVVDVSIVQINVIQEPVDEQIVVGTHLSNGMVAHTGSGTFYWPVPNYKYVSRWMSSGHKGADIVAPYGTPIIAADSGVVEVAGWHNHPYGYGNYVIIDHGNGWETLYGHMSSIAVTAGQAVEAGQVIGYVGNTGYSFGNHCHFEMYYNNTLVSAQQFFPNM